MDLKKLKAEAEFNANLVTEINALRKKALSKFRSEEHTSELQSQR